MIDKRIFSDRLDLVASMSIYDVDAIFDQYNNYNSNDIIGIDFPGWFVWRVLNWIRYT